MEESTQEITMLLELYATATATRATSSSHSCIPNYADLAAYYMRREEPGHTLQATALVHEAYLRLVANPSDSWQNRAHFFATAAQAMRRIRRIRPGRARPRSEAAKCSLWRSMKPSSASAGEKEPDFVALDDALNYVSEDQSPPEPGWTLRFFAGTIDRGNR